MAISSDIKPQHIDAYCEGEELVPSKWEDAFEWRYDDADSIKIGTWGLDGLNRLPGWTDGSSDLPTGRVVDNGSKTVTYTQYGLSLGIRKMDVRHVANVVPKALRMVGRAIANTRAILAAAIVNGAHSTTTVVPGAKALAATDHPTASGAVRVNKLASALDLGAIFSAMTLARQWVDYDNGDFDLAEGGWYLMFPVVAGLEQVVGQALGSAVTSDQNQVNTSGMFGISAFPWAKITTATHWALVSKVVRTLGFWAPEEASGNLDVVVDEDNRKTKIICDGAYAAYAEAQPSGFIGGAT